MVKYYELPFRIGKKGRMAQSTFIQNHSRDSDKRNKANKETTATQIGKEQDFLYIKS